MFTGIIEAVGTIMAAKPLEDGIEFRIATPFAAEGLALGESIAVDGICLTVADFDAESFTVVSVAATLSRTTAGTFSVGRRVNLERALALGGRLGGHLVQGHVDGVGEVLAIKRLADSTLIDFSLTPDVAAVSILHGSIALNGISLTINALPAPMAAQVSIVPFTSEHTNISELDVGVPVNLEGDLIGKYVRHLVSGSSGGNTSVSDLSSRWV